MNLDVPDGYRLEISSDDGTTWRELRRGYQQTGTIVSVSDGIVTQHVGRGATVLYRIVPDVAAES